jgi:lysophospholipase L1-like esterase
MKTILLFGDSNFWGWVPQKPDLAPGPAPRLPYGARLAGLLQASLDAEFRVVEDALPGRTAMVDDPLSPNHRGIAHLETALEVHAPVDLLILQLGANELRHMFGMSAGMIACSVERLVALAQNPASGYPAGRVLVMAPHPLHPRVGEMAFGFLFGPESYVKSLEFSQTFREMAARQGAEFFDCAPLGFTLNEADGVHYAQGDIERLAAALREKILEIL